MGLVKMVFGDTLKEHSIAKKMKENAKQKAVSSKASNLKREFDLSDDEAEFMARRATNRENRNKKISQVVSGTSSVITSLATALDQDVGGSGSRQPSRSGTQQNKQSNQNKNKKSGKHKKKSGSQQRSNNSNNSKKSSQKFNPMEIDADLNMDIPFFEF